MNSRPLARLTGNIPILTSGILHSTPLKKFLPRNLEIIYQSLQLEHAFFGFSYIKSDHTHSKEFEVYFPHQYM
jgi:hypothetical protein